MGLNWGPVLMSVVFFIILTPGVLFQLPGKTRVVEFGGFQTSGAAIVIHTLIFFACITVSLIALHIHIYAAAAQSIKPTEIETKVSVKDIPKEKN
ncbi:hypothetical protein Bca101_024139 [Brassica carinata]